MVKAVDRLEDLLKLSIDEIRATYPQAQVDRFTLTGFRQYLKAKFRARKGSGKLARLNEHLKKLSPEAQKALIERIRVEPKK